MKELIVQDLRLPKRETKAVDRGDFFIVNGRPLQVVQVGEGQYKYLLIDVETGNRWNNNAFEWGLTPSQVLEQQGITSAIDTVEYIPRRCVSLMLTIEDDE